MSCTALKFGRGNKGIVGMTSSEGESFAFRSVVPVEGAVEVWMTAVEAEMRRTLAAVMKEGECCRVEDTCRSVLHCCPQQLGSVLQTQKNDLPMPC